MNGFKIIVNLSHIFNDHRSICRIFVNLDRMKTIKDLQDHIMKIFNIPNFYLLAENQFLPSTENVRVLNCNDKVSVIPLRKSAGVEDTKFDTNDYSVSKISYDLEGNSSEDEEECTRKKRKKKSVDNSSNKKRRESCDKIKENETGAVATSTPYDENNEETNKTSHQEKKLKKINLHTKITNEPEQDNSKSRVKDKVDYFEKQVHQPNLETVQKIPEKSLNPDKEETDMSILNISDLMRQHKLYIKPNEFSKKLSTELPQQRNILKNIIVSLDGNINSNITPNSNETSNLNITSNSNITSNTNITSNPNITPITKTSNHLPEQENKINVLQHIILTPGRSVNNTEDSANFSLSPKPEITKLTDSQVLKEGFVTKRKRVRTRKKKSKDIKFEASSTSEANVTVPNFGFKPKIRGTPAVHIKFNENSDEEMINVEKSQENVEEIANVAEEENKESLADGEVVEAKQEYFKYVTEAIEKCPLMTDVKPQVGNIIAFKILKLGYSFTPELSNYIVGRILNITEDGKSVSVNILDGLEEAKSMLDNISLDTEEELRVDGETTYTYEWCHLVMTRLLSPLPFD